MLRALLGLLWLRQSLEISHIMKKNSEAECEGAVAAGPIISRCKTVDVEHERLEACSGQLGLQSIKIMALELGCKPDPARAAWDYGSEQSHVFHTHSGGTGARRLGSFRVQSPGFRSGPDHTAWPRVIQVGAPRFRCPAQC
ncbi:hypothetical protein PENSPDRAFT_672468 [Peniophora sp. CONT]|nr:hypothetical protein PENSPDRAFT_672468 [Peniophora sp. CONT]